jgi:uncharacterized protein (DUF427 family)
MPLIQTAAAPSGFPGPTTPLRSKRIRTTSWSRSPEKSSPTRAEASYPAVHYIPRDDVDMAQLARTDHATYCPYKGEASYFSIPVGGDRATNAVWTYENPYDSVAPIKDHLAFYQTRVDSIDEEA